MTVPNNKLRYILHSLAFGEREITPSGESSLKLSIELHDDIDDPLHDYIYKLTGKLVLFGEDYEWVKGIEDWVAHRGDDLTIEVLFSGSGEPVDLIPGTRLILNDGIFDLDKCTVEIPITTPDIYEAFNKAKDVELNMFDLLSSGPFYDVNVLDYKPKFEVNYSPVTYTGGTGTFDITDQHFAYYPNKRAQYPGFSVEGETEEPGYPNAAEKLFASNDLVEMENNGEGTPNLDIGAYPYHNLYPAAPLTAKAEGWRLYAFRYDIFNNPGSGTAMGYFGYFCWVREIKDVAIGTAMTDEWFFVGVVAGMDRWARPAILVPRTNVNRTAFSTEAFPGEAQVRLMQTCYVVGLDIANITPDSSGYYSDGTLVAPTDAIMDIHQDFDYKNYYSFTQLSNGRSLNEIIEFAIEKCDPLLTVVSNFFQINPTTVSSDNYVTGEASFVDDIIMFQKSDVKRPFASNHATKGFFSTSQLLYWLFKMFKVKYRIDGTDFRIEWIESDYFVRDATLDLTMAPLNRMLAATRRYSYDKETRLPAKETFSFMEKRPQGDTFPLNDLNGVPILYNGSNVDRTKENGVFEHLVDKVTTDVYFIMIHSGGIGYLIDSTTKNSYPVQDAANDTTIDDDGFVFVASKIVVTGFTSERYMIIGEPIVGDNREMNNVLGWAFLHDAFFRSYANTKYGQINNLAVTFDSTKYIKKSISLPFNQCDIGGYDPFEKIISALGTGIVKTADYNFQEEKLTVVLGYQE